MTENNTKNNETSHLPEYNEIKNRLDKLQQTFFGSIFPILPEEKTRFFIACIQYCTISFTYAFLRIFKKNIIYSVMDSSALLFFKPLIFLGSLLLTGYIQILVKKHGPKEGFGRTWLFFSFLFLSMTPFLVFKEYLQPSNILIKNIFIGKTADLRNIAQFKQIAIIFCNYTLSIFYIASEVCSSMGMTYIFFSYINYCCAPEQFNRFLRPFLAIGSVGLLISGAIYTYVNNNIFKVCRYSTMEYSYAFVSLSASIIYFLIYFIKVYGDKEFEKPIYKGFENKNLKLKNKVSSISEGFQYAINSKLLISMCLITLCFNFTSEIYTILSYSSYTALAYFMDENPTQKPSSDFPTDPKLVGGRYAAYENLGIASFSIPMLLIPFTKKIFKKYGVGFYGGISILIAAGSIFTTCILSIMNYPDTHNGKKAIFNFFIPHSQQWLLIEAQLTTFFCIATKVGKYAFFDVVKESISIKIDPEFRSLFKGIFDGMCGKLGKSAAAGYGILIAILTGSSDPRYSSPISLLCTLFLCAIWIRSICYLHSSYEKSISKNEYMKSGFSKGFILKNEIE